MTLNHPRELYWLITVVMMYTDSHPVIRIAFVGFQTVAKLLKFACSKLKRGFVVARLKFASTVIGQTSAARG